MWSTNCWYCNCLNSLGTVGQRLVALNFLRNSKQEWDLWEWDQELTNWPHQNWLFFICLTSFCKACLSTLKAICNKVFFNYVPVCSLQWCMQLFICASSEEIVQLREQMFKFLSQELVDPLFEMVPEMVPSKLNKCILSGGLQGSHMFQFT